MIITSCCDLKTLLAMQRLAIQVLMFRHDQTGSCHSTAACRTKEEHMRMLFI